MRILITGGTGFLGRPLVQQLTALGYACIVMTRDPARARRCGFPPEVQIVAPDALPAAEVVIHLAGEGIVGLWTPAKRRAILDSRVQGTRRLIDSLRRAKVRPHTLLAASAVGIYGDRPGETLDETSAPDPAASFRAEVCRRWEAEANRADALGVRVVNLRIGNVMAPHGGFLGGILPVFRTLGGITLGDAGAVLPWLPLADFVGLVCFALANERWHGPLNLTHPQPLTRAELAVALARHLRRPCPWQISSIWLRRLLGNFASALVDDQRVVSTKVATSGYHFSCATWATFLEETFPALIPARDCAPRDIGS